MLSLALPAAPSAAPAPPRTLVLGGGRLAYQCEDGTPLIPPAEGAGAAAVAVAAPAPAVLTPQTPSGKTGKTSASAAATPAPSPAAPASIASSMSSLPPPAVPHSACRWVVDWRSAAGSAGGERTAGSFFLGRTAVAALSQRLGAGGALPVVVRRVSVEAVEDDDPPDAVFGLETGQRLLEEDYAVRGIAALALQVRAIREPPLPAFL